MNIVLGNLLIATAQLLSALIWLFLWLLIIRAVLSWVRPDPNQPIVRFICDATDPLLMLTRGRVPNLGMFDLGFLVIILALYFIDQLVCRSLLEFGAQLKPLAVHGIAAS